MKKLITAAVPAMAVILGISAFAAQPAPGEHDIAVTARAETAEDAVKVALAAGIIENADYNLDEDITRLEFCELAYNVINPVKELPVAKLARAPFDDVSSYKVNALAFVGIVSGKGEYTFAPDDKLTREEAAVILYRIAKYADAEMPAVKVDMTYSDNGEISDWAVAPVYSLKVSGIVSNSDGEKFSPGANYTVGETISSLVKLNEFIRK